jgi:hypothetical protein
MGYRFRADIETTTSASFALGLAQNSLHTSMSLRRFSNRSTAPLDELDADLMRNAAAGLLIEKTTTKWPGR